MAGTSLENDSQAVAANLAQVKQQITNAVQRAGRALSDVQLVAVSKTKPFELIQAAYDSGQTIFGENYVQEALEKVEAFSARAMKPEWHLIGSLQTNKAKLVTGRFSLIHSVDRIKLAEELAKYAERLGLVQDILVQINVGDESTKHGVSFDEAPHLIERIQELKGLRLRGLMSLPPLSDNEAVARGYFASLREAFESWRSQYLTNESAAQFSALSMGTSSDFEWAILEGATLVRVGTSIFGPRRVWT